MDQPQFGQSAPLGFRIGGADERFRLVESVIEALRPGVQRDGGDLTLVAVEGDKVKVRLSGACTTCSLAGQTLGGVRRRLVEVLGAPVRVVPAVD